MLVKMALIKGKTPIIRGLLVNVFRGKIKTNG